MTLTFANFENTIDFINPRAVVKGLTSQRVVILSVGTLTNIYKVFKANIKMYNDILEFPTNNRVRQGDALSSKLPIATLENIFSKLDRHNKCISVNKEYLYHKIVEQYRFDN